MKKKPTITLTRGNTPKLKNVGRRSPCWRCGKFLAKNDKVFEVPGATLRNNQGEYYKDGSKRYCVKCMEANIARTEKELMKIKKLIA